jgi:hypothetical protein
VQDRYAGDIGDFSKFALARVLHGHLGGPTGLIWYRFPDEVHNNDGRHIDYLPKLPWIIADPSLIQKLKSVIDGGSRTIRSLVDQQILPPDTIYFDEAIHPLSDPLWSRSRWFERASESVKGCTTVVVDPDNGIAGVNHSSRSRKGGKHITLEEISGLAGNHDCLMIYHHFDRSAPHSVQIERQMQRLKSAVPDRNVIAVRYARVSPRAYFIVFNPSVEPGIQKFKAVVSSHPWDFHFTVHAL